MPADAGPLPPAGTRASFDSPRKYRFGRAFSLGGNKRYQFVFRRGKTFPGGLLSLTFVRGKRMRVGFSVSAKVGNSVVRHRVRRRMTEDFRLLRPDVACGMYVFVARAAAKDAKWQDMAREMRRLLRKAGLLKQNA